MQPRILLLSSSCSSISFYGTTPRAPYTLAPRASQRIQIISEDGSFRKLITNCEGSGALWLPSQFVYPLFWPLKESPSGFRMYVLGWNTQTSSGAALELYHTCFTLKGSDIRQPPPQIRYRAPPSLQALAVHSRLPNGGRRRVSRDLVIITGVGQHSEGQGPRLRDEVQR